MRKEVLIYSNKERGNITLFGSYKDNKNDRDLYLLAGGKKVVTNLDLSERLFSYTFEAEGSYSFSYDEDTPQDLAVLDFWKNHPLVSTEGYENPNFVKEEFYLVEKDEQIRVAFEELESKLSVVAKINGMSPQKQYDMVFAMGGDARGMSPREVYLHIIGESLDGLALNEFERTQDFMNINMNEKEALIYANKAIQYNIIKMEGSVYKIGGKNAGMDIDSVVSFLLADDEMYRNYIKPQVDKKDKAPEDQGRVSSVKLTVNDPDKVEVTEVAGKKTTRRTSK